MTIRPAASGDEALIVALIREMAAYERAAGRVSITEAEVRERIFGVRPYARVFLGFMDGEPAAYAMVFDKFSSYTGKPILYLEDVFVRETLRGRGLGKLMMARVARHALESGALYLEWSVLDWNEPALDFYGRLGASKVEGRTYMHLEGEGLERVASSVKNLAAS